MIEINTSPSIHKDPLARARGLGSAKTGTQHWLIMQITTAALIPLSLYLLCSFVLNVVFYPLDVVASPHDDLGTALRWIQNPLVGIPMLVMIPTAVFNSFDYIISGLIEDYVHQPVLNVLGMTMAKFAGVILAVTGIAAIMKIMLGA